MVSYTEITDEILIRVSPLYLDAQSDPMMKKFVFAYFIRIENHGAHDVQLLRRHWFIHDGAGEVKEVEGEGVAGIQPVIAPQGSHEYNSFCVLRTFEGSMEGTYLMEREGGEQLNVTIPRFALRAAAN